MARKASLPLFDCTFSAESSPLFAVLLCSNQASALAVTEIGVQTIAGVFVGVAVSVGVLVTVGVSVCVGVAVGGRVPKSTQVIKMVL